jgi:hypothetical protein
MKIVSRTRKQETSADKSVQVITTHHSSKSSPESFFPVSLQRSFVVCQMLNGVSVELNSIDFLITLHAKPHTHERQSQQKRHIVRLMEKKAEKLKEETKKQSQASGKKLSKSHTMCRMAADRFHRRRSVLIAICLELPLPFVIILHMKQIKGKRAFDVQSIN